MKSQHLKNHDQYEEGEEEEEEEEVEERDKSVRILTKFKYKETIK